MGRVLGLVQKHSVSCPLLRCLSWNPGEEGGVDVLTYCSGWIRLLFRRHSPERTCGAVVRVLELGCLSMNLMFNSHFMNGCMNE